MTGAGAAKKELDRDWMTVLAPYRHPNELRSLLEILLTAVPLVALWFAAWVALSVSYWLSLLFMVPAAAFLVRLFLIQHDCGHGTLFRKRWLNDWVGRVIGIFTFTPYDVWRRNHAYHHSSSGDLSRRGTGDIDTLTVDEYLAAPFWRRVWYRIYRNPLVMFGIGPAYIFLLQNRVPIGQMRDGWRPWVSSIVTNIGIAALIVLMVWLVDLGPFLMVHIPIVLLAASMGVWLFYVQHQFEDTMWAESQDWSHQEAALHGSSFYDLPGPLNWLTANIGMHHVHHLYSRIPFYRLPQVLRDFPEFKSIGRVTIMDSLKTIRLKLWCPETKTLVTFDEALRRA